MLGLPIGCLQRGVSPIVAVSSHGFIVSFRAGEEWLSTRPVVPNGPAVPAYGATLGHHFCAQMGAVSGRPAIR
jgi:hypothetical protein